MSSIAQTREFSAWGRHLVKMQHHPWILSTKAFDGSWEYRGRNRPGTSNLQFARRRIGQKFNVPYSLLQLIECRPSARKQSATVDRGLDPLRIAIKQAHRKHVLKAGDNVRNGGLSQSELGSRFGHTAGLHNREKDLQVPESQASADMLLRTDF